jgi:hypothetical protein
MRAALTHINERGDAVLRPISPFTWVQVAVGAGVRLRMVPGEFWSRDVTDDGEPLVVIACPCGHDPKVQSLEIQSCACERTYFNGVNKVWALATPTSALDAKPAVDADSGV